MPVYQICPVNADKMFAPGCNVTCKDDGEAVALARKTMEGSAEAWVWKDQGFWVSFWQMGEFHSENVLSRPARITRLLHRHELFAAAANPDPDLAGVGRATAAPRSS
jgi:hypothetical protein